MITAFDMIESPDDRAFVQEMEEKYQCRFENEYWNKIYYSDERMRALVDSLSNAQNLAGREGLWTAIRIHILESRQLERQFSRWLKIIENARRRLPRES